MKYLLLLFLLFATVRFLPAQPVDSLVAGIVERYTAVRAGLERYDTKAFDIQEAVTEGAAGAAYFADGGLRLIELVWMGEMGKREMEYYYEKGRLALAIETRSEYNRPIYWDTEMARKNGDTEVFDPDRSTIRTEYFYFQDGRLLRWLDGNGDLVDEGSPEFPARERELSRKAERLKEQF